ncbi:MAG: hypothetical protein JXB49_08665 [Bacteroidales bacterium]|nr:hypothetical protein [Bacteroidales bacterium]
MDRNKQMILIVMFSCIMNSLTAQDADDIITKYLDSMGGVDRLRNWVSLKVKGRYTMLRQSNTVVPFEVWYIAPNKKRTEMTINGEKAIYAFDGCTSWFVDPSKGVTIPAYMPELQAKNNRDHADEYPFIEYRKKGHKVEFIATEELEGNKVHVIKLCRDNGTESIHYFDSDSGFERKILINSNSHSSTITTEIYESDFRSIKWLTLPFFIETRINGQPVYTMVIDEAEIDCFVEESLFTMPQK